MSAVDLVLSRLEGVKQVNGGWMARCASHDDRLASLSIGVGQDGRVLLKCFAGCEVEQIVAAIGLDVRDLFEHEAEGGRRLVECYDYVDEHGALLYQAVRYEPKTFKQRRPDGRGGWVWKLGKTRRVLYRLPQVIAAVAAGETIWVVEGEKDVHALMAVGLCATTNAMGAGSWGSSYATTLRGAHVVIVQDRDETGRAHARKVYASLLGVAESVRIVEAAEGKDASDHLAAGLTVDGFRPVPPEDAERPKTRAEGASLSGKALREADLTPLEKPPLSEVLDDAHGFITRYVHVGEHEAVASTLWVAHTHVLDAFDATGYLDVSSPVRRCGKSTFLDVLELLVPRPWKTIEPSEAVFYRKISQSAPLLLDEADAIFNRKSEATEGLRACLNVGNKRGTTVPRCVPPKMETVEFKVFCPKVLAGIGGLPPTITDRSIPIKMRRKQPGDRVERFRSRKARELAAPVRTELERWSESATAEVELELIKVEGLADEGGPLDSLDDRAWEQAWEPLIAAASLAGEEWLAKGIAAAVALSGSRDDELDEGVNLLADIRAVFGDYPGREELGTFELLDALLLIDESPWRDWWSDPRSDEVKPSKAAPRKLARTLKPFGVRPVDIWTPSGVSRKGYRLDDFRDAWARYLVRDASEETRYPRGPQEPISDAGSGIADAEGQSARAADDGRDPRGDTAQPSRSRPPRPPCPSEGQERDDGQWLARDGVWRSFTTDPPAFASEVVQTRHGGGSGNLKPSHLVAEAEVERLAELARQAQEDAA